MSKNKKPAKALSDDPIHPYTKNTHIGNHEEGFVITPGKDGKEPRDIGNPLKKLVEKIKKLSKKEKIIFGSLAVVFLIVLGGSIYAITRPAPEVKEPVIAEKKEEPPKPKPTKEPSKLTGVDIPIETNKRPVTSVQIENSPDARPQASLIDAGVVFEAIAEGGITRFNANYLETKPDYIGPIRSARPYYVEMAAAFDPVYVHAGGSAAGLVKISQLGLKDLDHGPNAGAFQRVSDRFAPHNLYSSTSALDQVIAARGYKQGMVKGFKRREEKKNQPINAGAINLNISSFLYNVTYNYAPEKNSYNRVMGGQPHRDHRSGKQISPKVVIAMVTDYSISGIYSVYRTTGSGEVFIFQDGRIAKGTWAKKSAKDQLVFKNAKGEVIPINKGQAWITLMGASNQVSWTP